MKNVDHPLGRCVFVLTFGTFGNAAAFQGYGWSQAEVGFTWSCGEASLINLPTQPDVGHDWLIVLEGHPYIHLPETVEQRITLNANGTDVFSFSTDASFRRVVRIDGSHVRDGLALKLCHPTCDSPSRYGSDDLRLLAVAMQRLCVIEVSSGRPLDTPLPWPASAPTNAQSLDGLLLTSMVSGDLTQVSEAIADVFPDFKIKLCIEESENTDFSVVLCTIHADRSWTFEFSSTWRSLADTNPAARMIAWHLLATLPLFVAYSLSNRLHGTVPLSLGDEAHSRGLAFCAQSSEVSLIPDPYFMRSFGYRDLKDKIARSMISYRQREAVAIWRGGTTGYREERANVFALPRVQLCILSVHTRLGQFVDAGFTNFVQISPEEEGLLRDLGLVKNFVEPGELVKWMFHIDIDGNTSSWPGLFQKLISASAVLRVASKSNWKQWYYHRLEPYVNYMPVDGNFLDLTDKLRYLIYNERAAETIGLNGALLAQSLTYENELNAALSVVEDAIARETLATFSVPQ